jgi:hypothetical protein
MFIGQSDPACPPDLAAHREFETAGLDDAATETSDIEMELAMGVVAEGIEGGQLVNTPNPMGASR